uniref:NTF2 domain-containing protein n=1 Tax=Schizaphis graminum TaxID=13262 RepID=A0A2S2NNN3_SCHGA
MNDKLENEESIVLKFVQDFFVSYDINRHILHTFFPEDGTFIVLGNRMSGHSAIQQAMLTMATTTHQLFSIDIVSLNMPLPEQVSMYQVLCAGNVEFGGYAQLHGFTAALLIYFLRPNVLNVVSFNERCQWPKLS